MYEYDDDPEQALSDACEEYLFEVLTDCPDEQICRVLDRVDEPKRQEIIQKILDAVAFYQTGPEFKPTADALRVLQVLAEANITMIQVELESATRISRKTIGRILQRLGDVGLIAHPDGPRKGVVITPQGRGYLPQTTLH